MDAIATRRKSVALSKEELAALKKYRSGFLTTVECAESIGINRTPLERVLTVGSGSPETIDKIKKVLGTASDRREEAAMKA